MAVERLVLDASYALEVVLPSFKAWHSDALDLLEAIAEREVDARVPWVFFAELAYVVTKRVRGGSIDAEEGDDFLRRIDSLAMHVDVTLEQGRSLHRAAIDFHCGAYDAIYLAVARQMAIPIATRDRGMASAARRAGIEVFERLP